MHDVYYTGMHRGEEPPRVRALLGWAEGNVSRGAAAAQSPRLDAPGHSVRVLAVSDAACAMKVPVCARNTVSLIGHQCALCVRLCALQVPSGVQSAHPHAGGGEDHEGAGDLRGAVYGRCAA